MQLYKTAAFSYSSLIGDIAVDSQTAVGPAARTPDLKKVVIPDQSDAEYSMTAN